MKRKLLRIALWIVGLLAVIFLLLWLNQDAIIKYLTTQRFSGMQEENLQQTYEGILTREGKQEGLFPIHSTGISTKPIQKAAEAFLETLNTEQREKTTFSIDDAEWRKWSNVDNGIYLRAGVSFKEMSKEQRNAAFDLLAQSLSARGLSLSKDIMKTDHTLQEIKNGDEDFGEELYFFTLMGTPSQTEPWGWQLDGHHLAINYFILGDQVVMTPTFMGAEPVITTSGKYKGNTLFQDEQNKGLALMKSLSLEQQKKATISAQKTGNNNRTEAFHDNLTLDYKGLKVSEMDSPDQKALLDLIGMYVHNMRDGHAEVKMTEVKKHLNETWFAWIGGLKEDGVFYYRIHSPVIIIEFDHQSPVGVPSESREPTRNHIHTVVRTPNGNDYGKDLLRQHLENHHHE